MLEALILLWFVTSFCVIGYGLSNQAVLTLKLPRWSSLAVTGVGVAMLLVMFAGMYGAATDATWIDGGNSSAGDSD